LRQLPITGAYAFTDYRSQGQTISRVIVDIATPPESDRLLSLFNVYIALSRIAGRQSIRLLRDFDDETFLQPQDSKLLEEDQHVALLNSETENWWRDYS
jgi:ATP-dependent exoDNAse (exonuclease V) alpha subunit